MLRDGLSTQNKVGKNQPHCVFVGDLKTAQKILTARRIRIIRKEVGGTRGRRVRFDTATNTVFCRFAGQIAKNRREL
jgi:chemotaxis receptor (MCP) glutamine deamidase CheD